MTQNSRVLCLVFMTAAASFLVSAMPTHAGGRVGFTITPQGKEAEAVRTGVAVYSMIKRFRKANRNSAGIEQSGIDNGAAISQKGENNWARIVQRGRGNSGSISQNGNDNAFALLQFGKRNETQVSQNGNGSSGLRLEFGW